MTFVVQFGFTKDSLTTWKQRLLRPALSLALIGPIMGLAAYFAAAGYGRDGLSALFPLIVQSNAVAVGIGVFLAYGLVFGLVLVTQAWSREKHLRRRNELMASVIDSMVEGVVVADTAGRFLVVNNAARRMMGGSQNGHVPVEAWSGVYGLYKPGTDQHYPTEELPLARVIRGEQVEETEIQIKNERLSEAGWASVTAGPIRDIRGGLIGGVAVFRDITSRRRAEELSLRLANAVEQTADSVMITDMEGLIQYVNPAFEHTTGYSREEAIGATPRLLRSGRQSPSYYRELWTTILDGKSFKATVVNRKRCGEHYVVEQTITPMRQNGAGDITHFVAVMRDLTDQLKAQEHGAELRLAASMQQLLFPRTPPQIPGYDIAGAFSPALATCGDYFDFLRVSDHRLAFVVADVCGHGLGPGLIMAATRGYLRSLAQTGLPLGEVVESLNRLLQDDLDGRHFVTMVVGLLDLPSGTLNWANMGHPSGFVLEASGAVRTTLRSTCKPLGLFAELGCPLGEPTVLEPGCTLVLMTDGVLETESAEGIQHGSEAALRVFRENIQRPAAEIVAAVIAATKAFSGATAQEDDITVVVVKRAAA